LGSGEGHADLFTAGWLMKMMWLASVTAAREMANERQAREDQNMAALHRLMQDWLDGQQEHRASS
jgi:hypothetical protein